MFEGVWLNDLRQGEGTTNFDDGSSLKAVYDQDILKQVLRYQDPTGTVYSPVNDETYKGSFVGNKLSGYGKVQYPNGDAYFG